jgi:DNA polymerase I-like protein with 3'-5' exonuclease and polymerase domains
MSYDPNKFKILLDFNQINEYIALLLKSNTLVAFDVETTGGPVQTTKIIGISFCYSEKEEDTAYIPLIYRDSLGYLETYNKKTIYEQTVELIKKFLICRLPKTAFNYKYEKETCYFAWNSPIFHVVIDPMITYYLRHETVKKPSLDELEDIYFPQIIKKKKAVKKLGLKDYSLLTLEEIGIYGAEDSYFLRHIAIEERKKLEKIQGYPVYAD